MLGDNQGSLSLAGNFENYQQIKYIDIQYYYTQELVNTGTLTIEYYPIQQILADILIKPLHKSIFLGIIQKILKQQDREIDQEDYQFESYMLSYSFCTTLQFYFFILDRPNSAGRVLVIRHRGPKCIDQIDQYQLVSV